MADSDLHDTSANPNGGAADNSGEPHASTAAAQLLEAYAMGERSFVHWSLAGSDLRGANLENSILYGADLERANLSGANLSRADLSRADLRGADLSRAILTSANLNKANLGAADLTSADLNQADIRDADLSGATLTAANVDQASLGLAKLGGADARGSSSSSSSIASTTSRSLQMTTPAARAASAPVATAQRRAVNRPAAQSTTGAGDVIKVILALIGGGWNLLVSIAIGVIVIAVGFTVIKGWISGSSLNEHSTCSQFQQASSSDQDEVLQSMIASHGGHDSLTTARFSVNLYCNLYGGSAHIDGIFGNGGSLESQPSEARIARPALVYVTNLSRA